MTPVSYTQQSLDSLSDEIRFDLVHICEKNAEWRDRLAATIPGDKERNQTCAKQIRSLARELRETSLGSKAIETMARLVLETGVPFSNLLSNGRDHLGRPAEKPEAGSPRHTIAKYGWPGREGLLGIADPDQFLDGIATEMILDYEKGLSVPEVPAAPPVQVPVQPGPGSSLEKDVARIADAAERIAAALEGLRGLNFKASIG